MARNENVSVQIIKNGLEHSYPGSFYTKIVDQGAMLKFGIERPFDIFHCYNGASIAIEVKTAKHPNKFKFSDVKTHQIDNLIKMASNQSFAFIAIHLWESRKTSYIYFVDIYDFLYWKNNSYTDSVNWKKFEDNNNISFALEVKSKKVFKDKTLTKRKTVRYIDFKDTYIYG